MYNSSRGCCMLSNLLVINNDSKLPIVLFVGQHFSGSLFCAITLLLCVRETTQGERGRRSKGAFPSPLRFSPKSVIPLERREEREHCFCNAQSRIPLSLLTPVPRKGVGDKTHKRLGFKSLYKRVADAHLVPF